MARCEIPAIPISFKNTDDDIELRAWLMTKSNRSGYIKDVLKEQMEKEKVEKKKLKQLYK